MKTEILFIRMFVLSCILFILGFTVGSCSDDDDAVLQAGYGYAQFKLYKSGLAETKKTRASTNELNYLRDAQKMKIVLINQDDGTEVVQTVGLEAMGDDSEFGLRSEKLQLMAGTYQIVGFYLFKADGTAQELKQILSGEPYEKTIITVINGGLAVQDIHVKVVNRGIVKFTVTKNFLPSTRATLGEDYLFSDIKYINVTVQEQFTKKDTTFSNVSVEYTEKLDGNGTKISVAVSDSLFRLPAGKYKVKNYTTIKKNKSSLEYGEVNGADFEVSDNVTTEVKIPVNFSKTTGSIKDYLILKEIWEALKGPAIPEKNQKGWSYSGVTYPLGTNWDFNKDIDLWGEQPGVGLDEKGRVIGLTIGAFGPEGDIPASLGELTELRTLSLGNHSEQVGDNIIEKTIGTELTEVQKNSVRNDFYNKFVKKDMASYFSEPIQAALKWQKEGIPSRFSQADVKSEASRPSLKDVPVNRLTNGIHRIPASIGNLVNLQYLYIANGKFEGFEPGTNLSKLENLTDLEIYNCPSMKKLPEELQQLPNLQSFNLASNPNLGDFHEDLGEFVASENISKTLQIFYLTYNNLTVLPDMSMVKKLGKLDCAYNKIKKIEKAFGSDVVLVQLSMDYNQIEELPRDGSGSFCGYADVESFSFAHNKLKKFPNIFSSQSIYVMSSVNFSFNEIDGFEGEEDGTFKGVNANTIALGGNKLKKFPDILFKTNSQVSVLGLNGNGIEEIPKGTFSASKYSYMMKTLDLTYNKLSKLPDDFNGKNMPFLYGVDISNNRFTEVPTGPMDAATLTVYAVRSQRDENGNRLLRKWPSNISLCPSLRQFCIGGNDLRKITDTISPYVIVFEIKDNPNISLNLSNVCNMIKSVSPYL
jgi:Leucine-rich repeat (LRR) protein